MSRTHILTKDDFTRYAIDELGLWDVLTGGDRKVVEVEVSVVQRIKEEPTK